MATDDRLSRVVSHALRHEPWLYELELDEAGWVRVDTLLMALRETDPAWASLGQTDLQRMIDTSSKRRHEMRDGRIRALYGHSVPGRLAKRLGKPPERLFHGTAPESLATIEEKGLLPMGRQYVHLSLDSATAQQVGRRKSKRPVVLTVRSREAASAGVPFFIGNESVWLAASIPPEFIDLPTPRTQPAVGGSPDQPDGEAAGE